MYIVYSSVIKKTFSFTCFPSYFSCHRITHFWLTVWKSQVIERRGTPTEEVWKDVSALPNFLEFTPHPKVLGPTSDRSKVSSMGKLAAIIP